MDEIKILKIEKYLYIGLIIFLVLGLGINGNASTIIVVFGAAMYCLAFLAIIETEIKLERLKKFVLERVN